MVDRDVMAVDVMDDDVVDDELMDNDVVDSPPYDRHRGVGRKGRLLCILGLHT